MNFLQYHLPKTAGRGVGLWLIKNFGEHTMECGRAERCGPKPKKWFDTLKHTPHRVKDKRDIRALVGHGTYPRLAQALGWDKWRTVTMMRPPAERVYSFYKYHERRGRELPSFEEWVTESYFGVCHCLFCVYQGEEYTRECLHRENPAVTYYASRALDKDRLTLAEAKRQLELCDIYDMEDTPRMVEQLSIDLGVSTENYRPVHVYGEGKRVSEAHRRLVENEHPLDMELYDWAKPRFL